MNNINYNNNNNNAKNNLKILKLKGKKIILNYFHTLKFTYNFQPSEKKVYFSYAYPYTFTDLN